MVGRAHPDPSPLRQGRVTGLRNPTTPTLPAMSERLKEAMSMPEVGNRIRKHVPRVANAECSHTGRSNVDLERLADVLLVVALVRVDRDAVDLEYMP